MKLKYYLRGLGIGILVTTVILSLAGIGRKNMTDEEVIKRAKELGMVESTLLSDLADQAKADEVKPTEPETSPQPEETLPPETTPATTPGEENDTEQKTPAGQENGAEQETASAQENDTVQETTPGQKNDTEQETTLGQDNNTEPEKAIEPAATPETPVSPEDGSSDTPAGETFTLVIGRGESSTTVSKNLQKAGIVEDAAAFDKFLCNNGYDKKIITGTYEIPYGASEEEIAKIITRK